MAPTRLADHIGRVLGDRYRLLRPVGSGASGSVFLADDVRLRRRVAVKVLHPALADDEAFLRRFRAEARAAAALNHPNIMSVYDWGEEVDGPYLVCEYLGGGSLRSMLDLGRRLSTSQALLIGLDAARGLDYAHRRGLVHRDIKPANLLFDEEGRLRIGDFGLARALAEAAWTEPVGAVLGTARYASPEQVSGAPIDGKADVYSLALVLVEAVTGTVPFAADTTVATLMGRLDRPIEAPPELGPLAPIVARAGRPDPAERLDAAAFGAALQAVAPSLPGPEPFPLSGAATLDDTVPAADPTDIGPRPTPAAPTPTPSPTANTVATPAAATAPTVAIPVDPGPDATWVMPADTAADATADATPTQATAVAAAPQQPYIPPPPAPELSKKGRRRRRRWPWVVLVLLLLIGGGAGGSYLVVSNLVPSHPLPSVLDRTEQDAVAQLQALEFKVVVRQEFIDGTVAGLVKSQTPPGGPTEKLEEGKTVTLVVSKGPTPTLVPELTGMDQAAAQQAVEAVGHTLGDVTSRNDEEAAEGTVLDWAQKGQSPPKGAAIDLVLSAGPVPRTVPNFDGKSYEEAFAALSDLDLEVSRVDAYTDDDDLKGTVVGTDPASGAKVARGTKVTVTVSKGRPVVPKLNGLNVEKATAALEGVGLKVGSKFGPGGGEVFLAVPGEGSKVKPGSSVTLYIL